MESSLRLCPSPSPVQAGALAGRNKINSWAGEIAGNPCLKRSAAEQDAGLYFDRVALALIRLELPLAESVSDRLRLIVEGAEEVDVLHFAFCVDDDADGNRLNLSSVKTGSARAIIFSSCA